jgi:hypothetical protein
MLTDSTTLRGQVKVYFIDQMEKKEYSSYHGRSLQDLRIITQQYGLQIAGVIGITIGTLFLNFLRPHHAESLLLAVMYPASMAILLMMRSW